MFKYLTGVFLCVVLFVAGCASVSPETRKLIEESTHVLVVQGKKLIELEKEMEKLLKDYSEGKLSKDDLGKMLTTLKESYSSGKEAYEKAEKALAVAQSEAKREDGSIDWGKVLDMAGTVLGTVLVSTGYTRYTRGPADKEGKIELAYAKKKGLTV